MRPAATRPHVPSTLYLAFELGNTEWVLAMTPRMEQARHFWLAGSRGSAMYLGGISPVSVRSHA